MYQLKDLSLKVFNDRYARRDSEGNQIEKTPEEMWKRVANFAAKAEDTPENRVVWSKEFYHLLKGFKFVPGGRILGGAGTGVPLTFYNCFVLPSPEDSRKGILDSVKTMVEVMSRGGGVGINLSTLRPRGSYVRGVNGTASGAPSFGGLYSYATGLITQGGSRRGALMLMLADNHPDIEEFITAKRTMGVITNANLSVTLSDRFMEAVKNNEDWELVWGGKVYKTVKSGYLWDLICESAWASGEPGVVFLDYANKVSNTWYFEKLISTNPCGEQPLGAWGVCNLGSINLSVFERNGEIDFTRLGEIIPKAVRFLDNVIDLSEYFFEENKKSQLGIRRVGLGTMGLADLLIKLKIRYGSLQALKLCHKLFSFIRDKAYEASVELACLKGAFPKFEREKYLKAKFIQTLPSKIQESIGKSGIRNAMLLTQAPTGTISILADTSSGIEPVYDFVTVRKDRIGENEVRHPLYEAFKEKFPDELLPEYFVRAFELTPEEHVKTQAVIQKYVDSSISKTVNAPKNHTVEDVKKMYQMAYDIGCKGIAYFREGSRDDAVLQSSIKKEDAFSSLRTKQEDGKKFLTELSHPQIGSRTPKPRPEVVSGKTYAVKTGYGKMYVTINDDKENRPLEIFATIGKTGGFFAAKSEAVCRLISLALRAGIEPEIIVEQIRGIRGPMPTWGKYGQILSIPDALGHVLTEHLQLSQSKLNLEFQNEDRGFSKIEEETEETFGDDAKVIQRAAKQEMTGMSKNTGYRDIADRGIAPECPECGCFLELSEGCMLCRGCGYSKCG